MKYGFEEKLSVISEITCGKGLKTVCRERHLDRTIGLTVTYNFNVTRSKYKGTGAGNDEKSRL